MSFESVIRRFTKRTVRDMNTVKRKAAVTLSTRIIISTPVDLGVLRNNWFLGINNPNTDITEVASPSPDGPIGAIEALVDTSKLDDILFLNNNLPYADAIEYDGHSAQAPDGMVRINVVNWDQIVEFHAKEVFNG